MSDFEPIKPGEHILGIELIPDGQFKINAVKMDQSSTLLNVKIDNLRIEKKQQSNVITFQYKTKKIIIKYYKEQWWQNISFPLVRS